MTLQSLPYILLLGFLFGSTLIASRLSVGQFSPTTYIWLRLALASLAHLAVYTLFSRQKWPQGRQLWGRAALLGVAGTALPMTGIVSSLLYQSSGVTSMLLTSGPALTVLMAHFTLQDERLTLRKSIGVILALSGALLLAVLGESGLPDVQRASPLGYSLVLGAMVFASAGTIYARKYLQPYDAFDVASIRMFAAALAIMPLSLIFVGFDLGAVNTSGYLALGWASVVGTFAGQLLAFYIIQRFGATPSALTAYVIPIIASLGGALVLGEAITAGMLAAMTLIVLGITLLNERRRIGPLPVA